MSATASRQAWPSASFTSSRLSCFSVGDGNPAGAAGGTVAAAGFSAGIVIGAGAGANAFQIGANVGDTLTVTTTAVTTVAGDLTSAANSETAVTALDTALDLINTNRATYGAAMSRLGFAINNLQITGENQAAARGRIVDADFAQETANRLRLAET